MNNSIIVIARFPLPAGVAAGEMRTAFAAEAPSFRNVPNLIRKQFLLSAMAERQAEFICGPTKPRRGRL